MTAVDTVLVCGGREYANADWMERVLRAINPSRVIHGDAPGADRLAKE